jgi:hypothetical protein
MSQSHYGSDMDRPAYAAGSVKRARERAQAGLAPAPRRPRQPMIPEENPEGYLSPPPRPRMPPAQPPPPLPSPGDSRAPKSRPIISRPTQAPHWPLPPGSPLRPGGQDAYRPPQGQPSAAPPRPARPSRIPSIVDQSRPQQPTPMFFTPDVDSDEEAEFMQAQGASVPATPSSRLTSSSVGTIPEFPVADNVTHPVPPPPASLFPQKKSANLGPPPSSRRGATSFYSNASYVSPIPEESLRSRGSYASSAAIPGSWKTQSPEATSPFRGSAFYDDSVTEKSRDSFMDGEDSGDESKLVRSASIGKKGKPSLVDTRPSAATASRPLAKPIQRPFDGGTGFIDGSSGSSNNGLDTKAAASPADGRSRNLEVPMGSSEDLEANNIGTSPRPSLSGRRSGLKLPPKLDINAVREMEARGSITSLPDLIKRATRLAAMMERGKRPASRFDLNDFPDEKGGMRGNDDSGKMAWYSIFGSRD